MAYQDMEDRLECTYEILNCVTGPICAKQCCNSDRLLLSELPTLLTLPKCSVDSVGRCQHTAYIIQLHIDYVIVGVVVGIVDYSSIDITNNKHTRTVTTE